MWLIVPEDPVRHSGDAQHRQAFQKFQGESDSHTIRFCSLQRSGNPAHGDRIEMPWQPRSTLGTWDACFLEMGRARQQKGQQISLSEELQKGRFNGQA
jgi:hypothetical protein